jgi:signal recognition particle receptor subunit beta
MVFFNYSTMQMAAKVVYYGPGLCGKTTNLHYIYGHTTNDSRGEMVSLETETDRTLFFDLLPLDVGSIAGFNTRIQLYTVPGQVFYNTTRKLVLKGVDGVVFVVDSQRAMLQANLDSFHNLEENLSEMGLSVDSLPLVLQYNKRDLADIYSVEELNQALNRQGWPTYEASAVAGQGVFETLKGISKHTLLALKRRLGRSGAESAGSRLAPPAAGGAGPSASAAGRPPVPAAHPAVAAGPATQPLPPGLREHAAGAAAPAAAAAAAPPPAARPPGGPAVPPARAAAPAALDATGGPAGPAAGSGLPAPAAMPATAAAAVSAMPAMPAITAAAPEPARGASVPGRVAPRNLTGRSRSVDVLSELEKLRREAMQPAGGAAHGMQQPAGGAARQGPRPQAGGGAAPAAGPARAAASNGRAELSRSIDMTLKRADFVRARRFLVSFQVEDEQHRVVDAVRDLQVEIKDTADGGIEKLLLRLNISLHAKE